MAMIRIPLHEAPGTIRESNRAVLHAHGYRVHKPDGSPLTATELESLLDECGRNAAQALYGLDLTPDDDDEPEPTRMPAFITTFSIQPATCRACHHQHAGPELGSICIGCPCEGFVP